MQPSFGVPVFTIVFNQTALNPDFEQQKLVEACKRGERSAQHRLYNQYSKAMFNTCLRMLKIEADAEDALQNAFIDVFTKLDSFRYESTIGAWIKRIVINTCINHLKKRKLQTTDWDESIPIPVETVTDHSEQEYQVGKIKRAMEELPDGYRVVFSLYLLEGYDHAEIGEILHISEATSKSQFSRAKQRIREILEEGKFRV
jgi:RNA polymerase sigma-70 factor (ECF subfamily)